ncbi:hypothetical protein ACVIHH_000271 [Bradyrhizobium sp. USDA 4518]
MSSFWDPAGVVVALAPALEGRGKSLTKDKLLIVPAASRHLTAPDSLLRLGPVKIEDELRSFRTEPLLYRIANQTLLACGEPQHRRIERRGARSIGPDEGMAAARIPRLGRVLRRLSLCVPSRFAVLLHGTPATKRGDLSAKGANDFQRVKIALQLSYPGAQPAGGPQSALIAVLVFGGPHDWHAKQ